MEDFPRRFWKRRRGVFKKTQSMATKFDAQAAVIIISKAGNTFAFGCPSVDSIVSRYLVQRTASGGSGGGAEGGDCSGVEDVEEQEERPPTMTEEEAGKRIAQALQSGKLESVVEGLGLRELDWLYKDICKIKYFHNEQQFGHRRRKQRKEMFEKSKKEPSGSTPLPVHCFETFGGSPLSVRAR